MTDAPDDSHTALATPLVAALRASAPYIHAHRHRTFVIHLPGEAIAAPAFTDLVYDIALLRSLGVRLVLVYGARPQIAAALAAAGIEATLVNDRRVTSAAALAHIKQAVGGLHMDIEARLSTGLASTPMAGSRVRTVSGNLVTAKPMGIVAGVDHQHTGEVRRVDARAIHAHLDHGHVVLLSCIGYSPSGELFNLRAEDVATVAATRLHADKLVLLHPGAALHERFADTPAELSMKAAQQLLDAPDTDFDRIDRARLQAALAACRQGVSRAHLVSFDRPGALLQELYSRDGVGTLIAGDIYDTLRTATPEDLSGMIALIEPLEAAGLLVPRSREQIELEIEHYLVMVRDGMVTACCAFVPHDDDGAGEFACVAVHPDYRNGTRASHLLAEVEQRARRRGLSYLFALTTKAPHWFVEHGFRAADPDQLPVSKRASYNRQRNSAVFIKPL